MNPPLFYTEYSNKFEIQTINNKQKTIGKVVPPLSPVVPEIIGLKKDIAKARINIQESAGRSSIKERIRDL